MNFSKGQHKPGDLLVGIGSKIAGCRAIEDFQKNYLQPTKIETYSETMHPHAILFWVKRDIINASDQLIWSKRNMDGWSPETAVYYLNRELCRTDAADFKERIDNMKKEGPMEHMKVTLLLEEVKLAIEAEATRAASSSSTIQIGQSVKLTVGGSSAPRIQLPFKSIVDFEQWLINLIVHSGIDHEIAGDFCESYNSLVLFADAHFRGRYKTVTGIHDSYTKKPSIAHKAEQAGLVADESKLLVDFLVAIPNLGEEKAIGLVLKYKSFVGLMDHYASLPDEASRELAFADVFCPPKSGDKPTKFGANLSKKVYQVFWSRDYNKTL